MKKIRLKKDVWIGTYYILKGCVYDVLYSSHAMSGCVMLLHPDLSVYLEPDEFEEL